MPSIAHRVLLPAVALYGLVAPVANAQLLNDASNLKILNAQSQMLLYNNNYFNNAIKQSGGPTTPEQAMAQYSGRVGCGSVNIGNQAVNNGGISNQVNVIITGDVINVGNTCK